jgi:toxin ParE1/3/4
MPKFILSEFVEAELADIWDYIAIDNLDAADRFLECAYRTFQELSRTPGMGRARAFRHSRLNNLRSFRIRDFENYLVFYCPIADGIEVFHVVHGARDLDEF